MKACIVRGTRAELKPIQDAAPDSLRVMFREQFDHNICELRLEGDALPEWCELRVGQALRWVKASVVDGVLYLRHGGHGMPDEPVK